MIERLTNYYADDSLLEGKDTYGFKEIFSPTPSKFFITASDPSSEPAVTPFHPNRSYVFRRPYSTSLYSDTPDGWTTSSAVLAYATHPFEVRTPTDLSWLHKKRLNPSTERPLC